MDVKLDESTHTYTLDGRRVPGVTEVLRLFDSYAGVPSGHLEAARELGDAVHYATELDDHGKLDYASCPDVVRPYVDAWRSFRHHFTPGSGIEQIVYSPRYGYAGTVDRVGTMALQADRKRREARWLIDLKTTATLMPESALQTAAYLQAWNESYPEHKVKHRGVVLLRGDGTFRLYEQTGAADFALFLSALNIHNWRTQYAPR